MKERFKSYLEQHFRHIAPTQAAMEYRKEMLKTLLDREQELRIKGVNDDDLIYSIVINELGDFDKTLEEFENKQIKSGELKRKVSAASVIALCVIVLLTLAYLLVGLFAHVWHPTWLIMVGGIFVGIAVLLSYFGIYKSAKKRKFLFVRASIAVIEVLLSVFLFLLLQLVFRINGAWLTFLAMVVAVLGVDTATAFIVNSKGKWIELPVFVEVFCVLLYVILGISLSVLHGVRGFWHPAWVMCLGGVVFAAVEIAALVSIKAREKNIDEKRKINDKHVRVDETYWTKWDD